MQEEYTYMNTRKFCKKIVCALVLLSMVTSLGVTGCSKKNAAGVDPVGTPETTKAPARQGADLFPGGDKDYFVPFQDPNHSYCTINDGLGTPVRQQGAGGCYSYAAVSSMQSNYLKKHGELIDINPIDLINRIYSVPDTKTGEKPEYNEEKIYPEVGPATDFGGDISRINAVLCADPLNGYLVEETNIFGCFNYPGSDYQSLTEDEIKAVIREYGAIDMTVSYNKGCKTVHGYHTQNYQNTDTNHVATIVGWDDDFPADCFVTPASRNGAWLVQNSFGEIWGNRGYYWVSYDMSIPTLCNCSVTKEYSSAISYGRFYDRSIYSSDLMEKMGKELDSGKVSLEEFLACSDVVTASVYEKKGKIGAIGFWTSAQNQPYTIEILDGEFGEVLATRSGSFKYAGYHTVALDEPLSVKKFTVVVKTAGQGCFEGESREIRVSTIFAKHPAHYEAKTEPGRSFVQVGTEWVDVTDPTLMSKLGLSDVPAMADYTTTGDPCITVLFK